MASRYERSLRNPLRRPLVGVPTHTPIRTKKISYRATAVVDVASYAAETKILWMPHAGCAEDVDVFRVVGGSISSGTNRTNSRFTASQFGDGLRARLVSARLTVCGCSAEDNGVIVAGTSVNEDISGYDAADLMSRISEKHLVIARTVEDEVHINYVPGSDDERVAFLDDVARGPYEGLRDITSEAYPARHVATWKGTSVDSEIVNVPYTYTYDTKDLVYGDVGLPFTYSYNDPILYYPWGAVTVDPTILISSDDDLIYINGVSTTVTRKTVNDTDHVNGVGLSNVFSRNYFYENGDVNEYVAFSLKKILIGFDQGYVTSDGTHVFNCLPKKIVCTIFLTDGSEVDDTINISAADVRYCWAYESDLYRTFTFDTFGRRFPCDSYRIRITDWWTSSSANNPVTGEEGSYYDTSSNTVPETVTELYPLNMFADGKCVHEVENIVSGVGTVTNNQVTQVNESTVSETVNVPYTVVHGRQQLLVEVHTNWEFIGTVMDGSETLTPSAVVTIGDGVMSDVFTTPRNAIEMRKRMDDTAEGFVGSRERSSRRKKLEMIEEDAYESP